MKRIIIKISAVIAAAICSVSCFNLEEKAFDRIDAEVYYDSETSVMGSVSAIYFRAAMTWCEYFCYLQEFSADQVAWRTWNGGLWGWDEALKFNLSAQVWTSESTIIKQAWNTAWEVIGLCNTFINDIEPIDPAAMKMSAEAKNAYIAEVRTIRAWGYYQIYELWGGALPLCTSATGDVPGSIDQNFETGCQKMWDFIATELDESVDALNTTEVNRVNQAVNRILKARLLLNSEIFIGKSQFAECAALCQDIIGGKYGNYSIANDFRDIYTIDNVKCPEVIFAFAFEDGKLDANWMRTMGNPYNIEEYFGNPISKQDGWNCVCLAPSYDNSGTVLPDGGTEGATCFLDAPYGDKLGAVYERFSDNDIRKQNIVINPTTGEWNGGIFLKGPVRANYGTGEYLKADADRDGKNLCYVDQVGTFLNKGKNLETVMSPKWGETNSGVRFFKYPYYPATTGLNMKDIDDVQFRLSEVVYMLAECKMRTGDSEGAKDLVNSVRKRYFSPTAWVTEKDNPGRGFTAFDEDWMLSQWGLEYLGEGRRRRTDLRRFDKFTQGQWWFFGRATDDAYSYPAKRDRKYEWYPLPATALTVNPGLVQNPNYN